ncbi:peptidase S8/S53 domain-containing protein, partial [Cladochytrium replicatum]
VRVGVIDTGIDYTHPAFGGCLGLGCRVSYGRDLVGNDDGTPQPRSDPRDCAGHGSHVAGIIAGNDQRILGVAPNATLAAYKVFTCDEDGGVSSDVLIAAMEQAYLDGMNVINLSVGGSSSWSVFPEAVAAGALARMGVLVVAAVGNDGTQGLWETSSPAIDASATAVGSLENTYYLGGHITLTKANTSSLRINYAGNDDPADIGAVPLIHVASNGCNNVTMPSLSGAIALVRRGGCTVAKKAKAASSMGAKALAVYNNVPGQLFVFATGERESTGGIPVVGVSGEDGERMAAVASGGGGVVAEVRWEAGIRVFGNYPRVLQPAEYSSWGYGPMFEVKPDISAPGSIVYSAYPVSKGSYATMSGTSMSTPYLAGAMALLVSRFGPAAGYMISDHPKLQLAKAIVQSTATKIPWPRNPTFISPACRVGSGMINVEAALSSPAILLPSVIHIPSIQQSNSFYLTKIQIHRSGSGPGDGTFSTSIPETADILPAEVDFETPVVTTEFLANASTSKTLPLFTVELPELASAGVRITPPLTVNAPYWFGGAIVAVPSDPALHSIRTVYVGITGDIGDVPIIPLNGSYPYLTITPSTNVSS